MKQCPVCRSSIEDDDSFCHACGEKVNIRLQMCGKCGEPLDARWKFCPLCGSKMVKQTTVETKPSIREARAIAQKCFNCKYQVNDWCGWFRTEISKVVSHCSKKQRC
jgi:predicted amidophosphoribosyltransferase